MIASLEPRPEKACTEEHKSRSVIDLYDPSIKAFALLVGFVAYTHMPATIIASPDNVSLFPTFEFALYTLLLFASLWTLVRSVRTINVNWAGVLFALCVAIPSGGLVALTSQLVN